MCIHGVSEVLRSIEACTVMDQISLNNDGIELVYPLCINTDWLYNL